MVARPQVTIAIPTYNRAAQRLPEALNAALSQRFGSFEVVVSDNASTDTTPQLLRQMDDPRLRYFRQPRNMGAHANFNFCVDVARGDYLLLLHDDDRIDPEFLARCIGALPSSGRVGVVISGVRVIDGAGALLSAHPNGATGLPTREFLLAWLQDEVALYLCNTLYHTASLRQIGGFRSPAGLFQDALATLALIARYGRADVAALSASFRRHDANRGRAAAVAGWREDSRLLLRQLTQYAPDRQIRHAAERYLSRKCYRQAAALPAPTRHWVMAQIWREFGFRYSPWAWRRRRSLRTSATHSPPAVRR